MYETFEHTADIGLRARAAELDRLFEDAARALFSVIVANPESIRPVQQVEFCLSGTRYDDLLFDWLAELLYTCDTRRLVFNQFHVHLNDDGLTATARGESIDRKRHALDKEVKAITYHGLKVERDDGGWLAEVIVDI
ncbi:MAG: archease [Thermoguttaceae bacterium]|jgi:SHS2 domain-containing protein